ncbi:MFS transporter [Serratia symbiotica]|uniref:MFS transporter n=1 Tax=Serratia symbiotica TaxID=138074 RepID=UPI00077BCD50|nr:MFS transporter [Serratia symbiotica]
MTNIRMLSLVGIYLVIFIDNLGASLIIPMLKPIVHDLAAGLISEGSESFRNGVYGMALGAFSIAMLFGAPLLGALSDGLGRKKTLLLCLSGLAMSYVFLAFALAFKSLWLFMAGRLIGGFFSGSLPVAQAAIIDVTEEKQRAKYIGYIMFFVSLGYVVGRLPERSGVGSLVQSANAVCLCGGVVCGEFVDPTAHVSKPTSGRRQPRDEASQPHCKPTRRSENQGYSHLCLAPAIDVGGLEYIFPVYRSVSDRRPRFGAAGGEQFRLLGRLWSGVGGTLNSTNVYVLYLTLGAVGFGLSYSGLMAQLSISVDASRQGSIMGMAAAIAALSRILRLRLCGKYQYQRAHRFRVTVCRLGDYGLLQRAM